jgi:hypothetical protein
VPQPTAPPRAPEIVECIDLLHNIIIDFEGLLEFSSNDCGSIDANEGTQLKKSKKHTSVASAKETRDLFCGFFHSPAGSVPWQVQALGDV